MITSRNPLKAYIAFFFTKVITVTDGRVTKNINYDNILIRLYQ